MNAFRRTLVIGTIALWAGFCSSPVAAATYKVIDGEYKLPASVDPSVTPDLKTELWAHVWRPVRGGLYPLVIFLHGNHGTCGRFVPKFGVRDDDRCDYTTTGRCPSGYVVTPSHLGYAYLAQPLASYGYVVVSINANRGINCASSLLDDPGLNLRRGRLVLRHLEKLSKWNAYGGSPASLGFSLKGLMDFSQVGLMGHSRGGEGMRAALAQYSDPGSPWPRRIGEVGFRSLFEIGPVDGQTSRILNAPGVVWNVLLPGCDGDVVGLQGIKPFDRMLQITNEEKFVSKSTFEVFGTNHNFYNTEWQFSESSGCTGQTPIFPHLKGSASQRRTAMETLIPFFRSNLGSAPVPSLAERFDPACPVPAKLASETSYARGFTPSPRSFRNLVIDNFDRSTGISSWNVGNGYAGLSHYEHGGAGFNQDLSQRAAAVDWDEPGGYLQVNAASGQGFDAGGYDTLEFRVMLRCFDTLCFSPSDPTGDVDFSIALADAGGRLSERVRLKAHAAVHRPGGTVDFYNELFQTVRIPLSDFEEVNLSNFGGVRFIFDRTEKSSLYLGNVRLTKGRSGYAVLRSPVEPRAETDGRGEIQPWADEVQPERNEIVAIRHMEGSAGGSQDAKPIPVVEIEMAATRPFMAGGALPALEVDGRTFTLSHYLSGGMDRLVFTLTPQDFEAVVQGAEATVHIGGARPWKFGPLDKSIVR